MKRFTKNTPFFDIEKESAFEIVLPSNPSTGYVWKPKIDPLKLTPVENVKTERESGDIGANTLEVFTFKALETGQTQIIFNYVREWVPDKPLDHFSFTLNII